MTALSISAKQGNVDFVKYLLSFPDIDVNKMSTIIKSIHFLILFINLYALIWFESIIFEWNSFCKILFSFLVIVFYSIIDKNISFYSKQLFLIEFISMV